MRNINDKESAFSFRDSIIHQYPEVLRRVTISLKNVYKGHICLFMHMFLMNKIQEIGV